MSWICSNCGINNVNANERCTVCRNSRPEDSTGFDSFDELCYEVTFKSLWGILPFVDTKRLIKEGFEKIMTPEEQLFADYFKNEAERVINYSDLELRSRCEELTEVIRMAKAKLHAVKEKERDNEAKNKKSGFSRSIESDEIATDAINNIQKRRVKLSEMDKAIKALMGIPGMTRTEAERIASARNATDKRVQVKAEGFDETLKAIKPESVGNFTNPFAVKSEEKVEEKIEVQIVQEEETTIIITKTEEVEKKSFNPFGK